MSEHHVPKGASFDTLTEIIAGWREAGADEEAKYTSDVEEATGIADAVGRQTRWLEELGVLERDGQRHRLTKRGAELAEAFMEEDEEVARETMGELLGGWRLTEDVRGLLRANPLDEDEATDAVAAFAGEDPGSARARSGVTSLLQLYEWANILERDSEGRLRIPAEEETVGPVEEAAAASPGQDGTDAGKDEPPQGVAGVEEDVELVSERAREALETTEAVALAAEDVEEALEKAAQGLQRFAEEGLPHPENKTEETLEESDAAGDAASPGSASAEEAVDPWTGAAVDADSGAGVDEDEYVGDHLVDTPEAAETASENEEDDAGVDSQRLRDAGDGVEQMESRATSGETAEEAASSGSEDGSDGRGGDTEPEVEVELGEAAEIRLKVGGEDGVEVAVDGEFDADTLNLEEAVDEDTSSGEPRPDGGAELGDGDDVEVSAVDGGVELEVGGDPEVRVSIGTGVDEAVGEAGEDAEEDAGEDAEAMEDPEGAGEEVEAGEEAEAEGTVEETLEEVAEEAEPVGNGSDADEGEEGIDVADGGAPADDEDEAEPVEHEDGEDVAEDVEAVGDDVAEAADASVSEAVEEMESLAEELGDEVDRLSEAVDSLETGVDGSNGNPDGGHALSLDVGVDADPEDIGALLEGVRGGLIESEKDS